MSHNGTTEKRYTLLCIQKNLTLYQNHANTDSGGHVLGVRLFDTGDAKVSGRNMIPQKSV